MYDRNCLSGVAVSGGVIFDGDGGWPCTQVGDTIMVFVARSLKMIKCLYIVERGKTLGIRF